MGLLKHTEWEYKLFQLPRRQFLMCFKTESAFTPYPGILLLEIYPKERIIHMWKDICKRCL